ncbi:baeRF3 domain-containing protein [Flavisolibacter nicotianae]|uniref:baeRF3 domain-containing protein n=1 Tax=Flavisolibacter nicotianae TaxID=2364882 RepID=UPI000EAC3A02|nr:hypothetical protein [Flavisolibacter nicotianae]
MKTGSIKKEKTALTPFLQETDNAICVSVIVPLNPLSPGRNGDPLRVEKAIDRAKEALQHSVPENDASRLQQDLDALYSDVDFQQAAQGIGLFVSASMKQVVLFFSPVREEVSVSNVFALQDLLYEQFYAKPYRLLLLSGDEARLYRGQFNKLEEVNDSNFPMNNDAAYEYSKPSRALSYGGNTMLQAFEKDKAQVAAFRFKAFARKADKVLDSYLDKDDPALVITGTKKDIALFKSVARHKAIGEVFGNYFYVPVNELSMASWDAVKLFLNRRKDEWVEALANAPKERVLTGVYEIHNAVNEGKGLRLFVEKEYAVTGYVPKGDNRHLYLRRPARRDYTVVDVVNSLIRSTLQKNGDVVIVENGTLSAYQRMALQTRY